MKAEIYSKTNCVFCDKAKMRLSKYNPTVRMPDQSYRISNKPALAKKYYNFYF